MHHQDWIYTYCILNRFSILFGYVSVFTYHTALLFY